MTDCTPLFDQKLATLLVPCVSKYYNIPSNNSDLVSWLRNAKQTAISPPENTSVLFVMGNEASDLDSCVSSIAYAYACHVAFDSPALAPLLPQVVIDAMGANPMRPLAPGAHPRKWVAVPVINIPEEDLALRGVATRLTRLAGIDESSLLFFPAARPALLAAAQTLGSDDVTDAADPRACLALVDHCALAPSQQSLAPLVAAIVDHHADQGRHPHAAPRVVAPCASAASLVAITLHQRLTAALAPAPDAPPPLARLLRDVVAACPAAAPPVEARLAALEAFPLLHPVLAATLAAAVLQALFPSALGHAAAQTLPAALATGPHPRAGAGALALTLGDLLACTVAVDSVGFSAAAGKRTAADDAAVRLLGWAQWLAELQPAPGALHRVPVLQDGAPSTLCVDAAGDLQHVGRDEPAAEPAAAPGRPPLSGLFAQLSALLLDTAALTSDQCLRLDVKVVEVGAARAVMSSVPRLLGSWGDAPDFLGAVLEYHQRVQADVLVICCLHVNKHDDGTTSVTRDVAVIGKPDNEARIRVEKALVASSAKLQPHSLQAVIRDRMVANGCSDNSVVLYSQGDARQSRKQLLPIVMAALTADDN
jgi:inorganic pyrophosphatase/exopolyphosphatase